MAIVRTTPKETNSTGPGPNGNGTAANGSATAPIDKTKSVVQQSAKAPARPAGGRPMVANRAQVPVKAPGSPSTFLNDTMAELRRVVWPTKIEVQAGTIVTIGLLIFFSVYIFGLDLIANWLFHALGLYPNTPTGT